MSPHRRAYIDHDTLYVIGEAVHFLADLRGTDQNPDTGTLHHPDLLHLLASLILQAQTWLHLAIEDLLHDDNADLTAGDIDYILAGARPDPTGWPDT